MMKEGAFGAEFGTRFDKIKNLAEFLARFEVEKIYIQKYPTNLPEDDNDGDGDHDEDEDGQFYVEPTEDTPEYLEIFKFKHNQELPFDLPQGYCLEGGAARNIVLTSFGEKVLPPRDHDIVAVQELNPDLTVKEELSTRYMSNDYKYGYGIESVDMQQYFQTRDFTINQLFIDGDSVYASKECLEDLIDKAVCPTAFEQGKWNSRAFQDKGVHPKLVMKSLRLYSEFMEMYGQGGIYGIKDWQWEFAAIPIFYLALGLEKATQLSDTVAIRFYMTLIDIGLFDRENTPNLSALAFNIRFHMREQGKNPFDFSDPYLNNLVALLEGDDSYKDDFSKYEEQWIKVNKNNRATRLADGKK